METENRFARMHGINLLPQVNVDYSVTPQYLYYTSSSTKKTHSVTWVQSNQLYSKSILLSLIANMYICRDSCDHLVSNAFSIQHSHFSCFHLPYHLVLVTSSKRLTGALLKILQLGHHYSSSHCLT